MGRSILFGTVGVAAAGLVALTVVLFFEPRQAISETTEFTAPGLDPLTIAGAQEQFWRLTPALLLVVYDAFGKTEEGEVYDTLASVTHGKALDYLYLERMGAMTGGGLDEADQTIHEIKLLTTHIGRSGADLNIDASWQVIGTVGHAEHLHVRGNTYSADLVVAPVIDAWKITAFTLREVNRDAAGETFLAPTAEAETN